MMLRRLLMSALSMVTILGVAYASQIALLSGPNYSDPSQILSTANTVIQSVNSGVTGNVAALAAPATTSGTAIQTLLSSTLAAGQLGIGQVLHVKAFGLNDGTADARTLTLSFGGSTDAIVVTSTSGNWVCDFYVSQQAAAVNNEASTCNVAAAVLAPAENSWTVSNAAAIAVLLRATAATAGTMTLNGAYMEILR